MAASPQKDPQREEVYKWERGFGSLFYQHGMKPRAMHRLSRAMADYYGVTKPKMLGRRLGKGGYTAATWGDHTIEVNHDLAQFTGLLVAHEMAHVITHAYGIQEPDHGPVWLAVYLHLMDRFRIIPASASVPSARKAGLKFKRLSSVMPGEL